jgi:hypothetical protein
MAWYPIRSNTKDFADSLRSGSLLSDVDGELKFKSSQILLVGHPGIAPLIRLPAFAYRPAHVGGSRDLLLAAEPF